MKLTAARFAVTGQTPPRLTEAIILAETVHRALVELSNGSQVFAGCDSSHRPLRGHGHAHIFCESNSCQGQDFIWQWGTFPGFGWSLAWKEAA